MKPDPMICYCKGVTRSTLVEAIRQGARTLKDLQAATGACTGHRCKELNPKGICCSGDIRQVLAEEGVLPGGGPAPACPCDSAPPPPE